MSEHVTTGRGDRVAYDHHGPAGAPAIVFIAGAGPYRASDPTTTETARLLAESGIQSTVHDRLGRGESTVDGQLDLDRELEAIAALIDAVGGRAVLCGHSSGCSIALAATARGLPVAGLALWEAPLGSGAEKTADWWGRCAAQIASGDLEGALATYMEDMPPEFLEGAKATPEYPQIVTQVVSYAADGESLVWAESAPLAELLDGIDVPVVAMVGEQTFPGMPEAADDIAAATDGRSIVVAGAWHSWDPTAMAPVLADLAREAARD